MFSEARKATKDKVAVCYFQGRAWLGESEVLSLTMKF
jgi:hypothetical protein